MTRKTSTSRSTTEPAGVRSVRAVRAKMVAEAGGTIEGLMALVARERITKPKVKVRKRTKRRPAV